VLWGCRRLSRGPPVVLLLAPELSRGGPRLPTTVYSSILRGGLQIAEYVALTLVTAVDGAVAFCARQSMRVSMARLGLASYVVLELVPFLLMAVAESPRFILDLTSEVVDFRVEAFPRCLGFRQERSRERRSRCISLNPSLQGLVP
jgi:hypothetical protein